MRFLFHIPTIVLLLVLAGATTSVQAQNYGTDRAGTSGFQFTKIGVDPRAAAMGNSNMADAFDGSSLYWNPALSARLEGSTLMASHTSYFADINVDYLSYIQQVGSFAVGGSLHYLSSGDIIETTEYQPTGTGRVFGTHHIAAGLSVAQEVTDLFSYGITFKYLLEKIEEVEFSSGAIDFGFSYLVGETGLRFAVGVSNFSPIDVSPSGSTTQVDGNKVTPEEEMSLPTRFNIAAAYDVVETETSTLVVTAQINNPSDNAEQVNIGAEYGFMDQFYFRSGYEFGNVERQLPSFGAGFKLPVGKNKINADYAYTVYDRLGGIHRISISVNL